MTLLYGVTIFISAVLLFSVQPMVGKMTLPILGGTAAVWNTCMVFFQAVLLAGYAYAHGTARAFGVRRQAAIHVVVLLLPLLVLPIAFSGGSDPPTSGNPVFWLLGRLFVTVGLPFFVVSTGAPLLQLWFAHTGHRAAKDPYFLYAASNLGSLMALLSYPVLIEPAFALRNQTILWAGGYVVLIVLVGGCALVMRRMRPDASTADLAPSGAEAEPPTWARRLWWVALACVPSSLMLGVTAHITTDVAAVPLFWVIPLAIYLLTFVLVFAGRQIVPLSWMSRLMPFILLPVALYLFANVRLSSWLAIPIHLAGFFVAAMVCHGELARTRPATRHLTQFYLLMSVGGVMGGVFNGLVAPMVFDGVAEYPLAMVLACLLRPGRASTASSRRDRWMDVTAPIGLAMIAAGVVVFRDALDLTTSQVGVAMVFGVPAIICFGFKERPVRFALGFGVVVLTVGLYAHANVGEPVYACRNFFGVKRVVVDASGRFRRLYHGSTSHGLQAVDPAERRTPLSYYTRGGPIGDVLTVFSGARAKSRVCVIGLGTGSLAAYAEPGQRFTFLEIDPDVERIARDTRYFTFLADSPGRCEVVLGDARLTLGRMPDDSFDMIILDAFSSDAVPTHLLALEAMNLYLSKLAGDGVLVFHVSNRHLNFEPMVAKLASRAGLACLARTDEGLTREKLAAGRLESRWMVMGRNFDLIRPLADEFGWHAPAVRADVPVWTDQYCDLLALFEGHRVAHEGAQHGE